MREREGELYADVVPVKAHVVRARFLIVREAHRGPFCGSQLLIVYEGHLASDFSRDINVRSTQEG